MVSIAVMMSIGRMVLGGWTEVAEGEGLTVSDYFDTVLFLFEDRKGSHPSTRSVQASSGARQYPFC